MKRFMVPLMVCCLLLVPCTASPAAYEATAKTAREAVWGTLLSGGGSAATVAVMGEGKIVYSECFGAAERASNRPVDRETRFNIGSTSKMFAAVAILMLADEGALSLDDPVVKFIPEFVMSDGRYREITVRMLFNHSSGLPGSSFLFEFEPVADPHELLLRTLREAELKHAPGAMSIYCNDGFTLAEMIVERLSGKRFIDFVAERIFEPLAMKHSAASVGIEGGNVACYYDVPAGKKFPDEVVQVLGAGGLSSTAEDLCRFGDSFTAGGTHILSDAALQEALKSQPTLFTKHLNGRAMLDAFGWDYAWIPDYRERGVQVLGKSGGTMFFSTNLLVLPKERVVIAVSLCGHGSAPEISRLILSAYMKEKGLPFPENPPLKKPIAPQAIPPELLAFEGIYVDTDRAVSFVFDAENGLLNIRHVLPTPPEGEDTPPPEVLKYSDGLFHDFGKGVAYYFAVEGEEAFLIADRVPGYGVSAVAFQRLPQIEVPKRLSFEVDGTLWLVRNILPSAQIVSGILTARTSESAELPGYAYAFGLQRVEDFGYTSIAATAFRDQSTVRFFRKSGKVRMKSGIFLFSQADEATDLAEGENEVLIGEEGENEWRRAGSNMILSFAAPDKGRVVAVAPGNDEILLYDSVVDGGEFYAPEGTLLFFAAAPGDEFEVKTR